MDPFSGTPVSPGSHRDGNSHIFRYDFPNKRNLTYTRLPDLRSTRCDETPCVVRIVSVSRYVPGNRVLNLSAAEGFLAPEKSMGWMKMHFLLGRPTFREYIKLQGGNVWCFCFHEMYDYGWFKSILVQYCITKLLWGCEIEMTGGISLMARMLQTYVHQSKVHLLAWMQQNNLGYWVYIAMMGHLYRVDPMTFEKRYLHMFPNDFFFRNLVVPQEKQDIVRDRSHSEIPNG